MPCSLPFSMQTQQQTQWCWAAVSASVARYYTPSDPVTQCALVNAELGQTTCCAAGGTPACNQPWYLNTALAFVGHLTTWFAGVLALPGCEAEVCQSARPVGVRIGWSGGGGHFVIIGGVDSPSPGLLTVYDPWFGTSFISYADLQTSYQGTGQWTHTYITQ